MAYITGTITDANPGPALHTAMASALTTAGYTLVDTVTISTRTHKVWKCAAANNSLGLDWYLDVVYTTAGAGTIAIVPFEFFDPATDLGYRGAYSGAISTGIETTYYSRYGATGSALETNWMSASAGFTSYTSSVTTSSFGYWISITPERVILLNSNAGSAVMFAGFYQPDSLYAAKAGANLYPLIAWLGPSPNTGGGSGASQASSTAGLTRMPPMPTLTSNGWGDSVLTPTMSSAWYTTSAPVVPTGSTAAYPQVAFPVPLYNNGGGSAHRVIFGNVRDVLVVFATGVARGDTVTIGGSQYVIATAVSNVSWLFKAA